MLAWTHSDTIELICKDKWHETPDSVSFILASADNDVSFSFKPGQFASLGVTLSDSVQYRAYSISSLPNEHFLQFTVKRVDGGLVSNYILDHLQVGERVTVLKPAGSFNNIDCIPQEKVTMISAGCGITPVMSMVKYWLNSGEKIDIDFVHMARDKANTIYFDELELLAKQYDNFHLKLLLKNSADTQYPQGRLDQKWLSELSPDITQRTVYLCGPVGFMQDISHYLQQLNFDSANFFEESFTPDITTDTETTVDTEVAGTVSIQVPSFGADVEADKGSMLIDALEKGGVPVIAACRSGICGSCKCKVTVGEVERTSVETLTEQDIEQGFVLACSCKVHSDVEVSLN
ncbi:hybrid-cluster NAD(P)-dependent oxidoreductase [Vibrio sp. MACH09]|uniref:hybrid-cluster NAD(P)-dependent oxidoreductase n=1 Tax=Vibrio sp. MACH09 TaxID=3025122 RepID=UPI0027949F68|nr:hybrid-cluster NAD(P)-dependent oxidoreductase [Vibrio sp. MACH09]GLO62696.1 hybrid-cluster NAD(P)-dependent oxidoreductase [Vibrio sp. MACH09]